MLINRPWAFWRRVQYGVGLFLVLGFVFGYIYFSRFYITPTCFDGIQNASERGVDCGGVCTRICAFEVKPPRVEWARSFEVSDGVYNAVAYIENTNKSASSPDIKYTFALYDDKGLIVERTGHTSLPENNIYPVFEGKIATGNRKPTKTLLTLDISNSEWYPGSGGREQFRVINRDLYGVDSKPKLNATIRNETLKEIQDIEFVATIFDANKNALTTSRTFIKRFPPKSDQDIVFTWPNPIAKTLRSCEVSTDVILAIDLSGSMNNDGVDPPQPISAVLDAAEDFVNRLKPKDQVGIVTFATEPSTYVNLSNDFNKIKKLIRELKIDPKEEVGSTNTGGAFVKAKEQFSGVNHNPNARKVMVLLTDGLATAPGDDPEAYALEQAANLKLMGVDLFTIGLGEKVNMNFIRALTDTEQNTFQAIHSSEIGAIYENITGAICEDGPAIIEIIPKISS